MINQCMILTLIKPFLLFKNQSISHRQTCFILILLCLQLRWNTHGHRVNVWNSAQAVTLSHDGPWSYEVIPSVLPLCEHLLIKSNRGAKLMSGMWGCRGLYCRCLIFHRWLGSRWDTFWIKYPLFLTNICTAQVCKNPQVVGTHYDLLYSICTL